ncbi:MAG: class I SAM-dependent methyltransferase [Bryobacterales bacterium]|nr:class I SAM-dependent methyltransferase [Bryobacterales bacterium]
MLVNGLRDQGMLGQASYRLRGPLHARLQKWCGVTDLHSRQKWNIVWPKLALLPQSGLSVLDAGCGDGVWSFEMAARRPSWRIWGIDLDAKRIAKAQADGARLGISNAKFTVADFLQFEPPEPVDLVLSIASAHYLAQAGRGPELLARFARWLRPGGTLILYGPRHLPESPAVAWLPKLSGEWGFTERQLVEWTGQAGLCGCLVEPAVGRMGTFAKQLAIWSGTSLSSRAATYPLTYVLDWLDRKAGAAYGKSSAWCVTTQRSPEVNG